MLPHHCHLRLGCRPSQSSLTPGGESGQSVTEGEIGFRPGDREAVLVPAGYITKPRNEMHAMWNAGDVPARMIEVISPAGSRTFFRSSPNSSRPQIHLEVAEIDALAAN